MSKHVDVHEIAKIFGVTPQTIRLWRDNSKIGFPKPDDEATRRFGKNRDIWNKQFWLLSEIEEWKAKNIVT